MRKLWVIVHRWFGLLMAGFLVISGLTGAVISWDHEIDEWLNGHLFDVSTRGDYLPPLELASRIEAADPRVRVTWVPLQYEEGHAAQFRVQPRVDPSTGKVYELGYNSVFFDPVSGDVQGRRESGKVALDREHLMPFLYRLHYTLHIPEMWGIDRWGLWLMGGIAVIWLIDCFIGFYLTLPRRVPAAVLPSNATFWSRWKPAWRIKTCGSTFRVNFDIHRAFGLWTWVLLFVIAFTAFSLNLFREVFRPMMTLVTTITPSPFDQRTIRPRNDPIEPRVTYPQAIAIGTQEALRKGWTEPVGAVFYTPRFGLYGVRFHEPGNDHGSGGFGVKSIYVDGVDARVVGDRIPGVGTAGDIFLQLQFPLHSGRIAGIPGRIAISIMGLVVAALSITGVVIWARKRRARIASHPREERSEPARADAVA